MQAEAGAAKGYLQPAPHFGEGREGGGVCVCVCKSRLDHVPSHVYMSFSLCLLLSFFLMLGCCSVYRYMEPLSLKWS